MVIARPELSNDKFKKFNKKSPSPSDLQVKIVKDFLNFIEELHPEEHEMLQFLTNQLGHFKKEIDENATAKKQMQLELFSQPEMDTEVL